MPEDRDRPRWTGKRQSSPLIVPADSERSRSPARRPGIWQEENVTGKELTITNRGCCRYTGQRSILNVIPALCTKAIRRDIYPVKIRHPGVKKKKEEPGSAESRLETMPQDPAGGDAG